MERKEGVVVVVGGVFRFGARASFLLERAHAAKFRSSRRWRPLLTLTAAVPALSPFCSLYAIVAYKDNFDAVNNMYVLVNPSKDRSIENLGDLDNALNSFAYLLGSQSYTGKTQSEGGFQENRVSTAAVLDQKEETIKGKKYYTWEILTRTADGDEGGRHQLIKATISNGNLYVFKVQAGDKRWFKGAERECRESLDSFTVV